MSDTRYELVTKQGEVRSRHDSLSKAMQCMPGAKAGSYIVQRIGGVIVKMTEKKVGSHTKTKHFARGQYNGFN